MCQAIAKYLLFAFNFVFWLAGAACLGVGIWLNVDDSVANSIEISGVEVFYAGAYILIVAGSVMLVVGFFGCCGAIKESKCLLGLYFGCLFVIFGLEVGIGIWALTTFDSIQGVIDESLMKVNLSDATDQNVLVGTQQNLKCCGLTIGCQDWLISGRGSLGCGCNPKIDSANGTCVDANAIPVCGVDPNWKDTDYPSYIYSEPCNTALNTFISDNFVIIGAVALAIGLAEILGMIIAMSLCCSIKDK